MARHGTVGFAVSEITGRFLLFRYRAIRDAAFKNNLNLITFEGRSFDSLEFGEAQQSIIYQLTNNTRCQSIIYDTSSVFTYVPFEYSRNFIRTHNTAPVISLNEQLPGFCSIVTDNYHGMSELVSHLIEEHKCRRLAFVTGPKFNGEANQRLEAFKATLAFHEIPLNESLVFEGDFLPQTGKKIAENLAAGMFSCDALVFANDDMALGALDHLSYHHPEFLQRIAITGFDNVPASRNSLLQLTTASQCVKESSELAIELALKKQAGEAVKPLYICKSKLQIRQTCGCFKVDTNPDHQWAEPLFVHEIYECFQVTTVLEMWHRLTYLLTRFSARVASVVLFPCGKIDAMNSKIPSLSQVVYHFQDGTAEFQKFSNSFSTQDILPEPYFENSHPSAMLVKPICYSDFCFGYAVYVFEHDIEGFFESLHAHLCLLIAQFEKDLKFESKKILSSA